MIAKKPVLKELKELEGTERNRRYVETKDQQRLAEDKNSSTTNKNNIEINTSCERGFKIFFMNIQCLTNKMDILNAYLYLLNFSVICICEHWMQIEEIKCTVLEGFTVASFFTRSNLKNGGTIIFVKKDINFTSSRGRLLPQSPCVNPKT